MLCNMQVRAGVVIAGSQALVLRAGLGFIAPRAGSPPLAQVDEAHTTEMQGIQARLGFGGARAERKGQSRRAQRAAHPC